MVIWESQSGSVSNSMDPLNNQQPAYGLLILLGIGFSRDASITDLLTMGHERNLHMILS